MWRGNNVGTLAKKNCVHRQLNSYMCVYMESLNRLLKIYLNCISDALFNK